MRKLVAVLVVSLLLTGGAATAADRVALVIGNGAYKNMPALTTSVADAKAMSAALRRLEFEVVEGVNLTNDGMRVSIGEYAAKLDGAKVALLYFEGHGISVGEQNYVLPTDANLKNESELDFQAVNLSLLLRQMQREPRVSGHVGKGGGNALRPPRGVVRSTTMKPI